jgi:hypothetical protein
MRNCTLCLVFVLFASGCNSETPALDTSDPATRPEPVLASAFDPAKTGQIAGRVTWNGPIPATPGFVYGVPVENGMGFTFRTAENPNRPQIDSESRAVAGAVVYLRGIAAEKARPWDLPPVAVEVGDGRISVCQGDRRNRVGFVRCGDAISVSSNESRYHVLRGRGDGFFSLSLPDANQPVSRTLPKPGRVELSSGSGLYWARADLFVTEHPYYQVTDAKGQFRFEHVPEGDAELVVWLPGWEAAKLERDPDSTTVTRQSYTPPVERVTAVKINRAGPAWVTTFIP